MSSRSTLTKEEKDLLEQTEQASLEASNDIWCQEEVLFRAQLESLVSFFMIFGYFVILISYEFLKIWFEHKNLFS